MLLISGWYDHFPDDVIRAFYDLRVKSAAAVRQQHKLLMGPWLHTEVGKANQGQLTYANATGVPDSTALRFFDYYLRGIQNGYDRDPAIRYYQMGTDEWRTTEDWLALSGALTSMYLHAGGLLSNAKPAGNVAPDSFRYDPRDPSPAVGGSRFNPFDPRTPVGPQDIQQLVENRSDVLKYSTPVLEKDLVLDGAVRVELFISSNCRDTDFAVRLCDVYPDGRSMIITQGIRRMRFRNSYSNEELITPRQIYPVAVELQNLAMTFLKGHQLRIDVSSSDYPHFDVNLNNGGAMYVAGDTVIVTNYIYHDAARLSRILLPVATTTSVQNRSASAPAIYRLDQNFPNPFNPSTAIRFSLPEREHVTLRVFDVLGREMAKILDSEVEAGIHTVVLNAENLSSGVYFCQLRAGNFSAVKKLLVSR
jgi:putative CocE/NonD family hydrolase